MNRQLCFLLVCLLNITFGFASTFKLDVEVTPDGAGSLNTSSGTYEEGSRIYLRTYNNTGYVFKGWYENDKLVSSSNGFDYTMPSANVKLQAKYEYDPDVPADPNMVGSYHKFSTTVSPAGAGSVNVADGKYAAGSTISLHAYTYTGYQFTGWKDETGKILSSKSSYNYTMPDADTQLTALYTYDPDVPADPDSASVKYTLTLQSKPEGSGSFNFNNYEFTAGYNLNLYAYTNTGYKFVRWEDESGKTLSTEQSFYYVMPKGNTKLYGVFEYDPDVPSNPGANHWNAETGELIMDDFQIGYLRSAIDERIGGSGYRGNVTQIIVSGKMNDNDFGLSNDFTNCNYIDLSRTGGYSEIPSYAFNGNGALTDIILPACVEKIGYRAFYGCTSLTSLTCYAATPPTLDNYVFDNISEGAVLYVPATAISAYQEAKGWKDAFSAILPITADVRAVEVNLPDECADGRYKNMTLELLNTVTGQKQTYVINDRIKYVFNGLVKNSSFNAYLRNQQGVLIGEISDIQLQEEDVTVTFSNLLNLYTVRVKVTTPSGEDVTSQTKVIQWIDADGNYLSRTDSIAGQAEGTALQCTITLTQDLGTKYKVPETLTFSVDAKSLTHIVALKDLTKVTVTGKVKGDDGSSLANATLSISQKINGLYTKSSIAKADNSGTFSIELYDEPTSLTVASTDYISKTVEYSNFSETTDLGQFELKSITGATITTNLTYTESVAEGETAETQDWYDDYANVAYSIYNKSTGKSITQFNTQYLQIVLLEDVAEGDQLKITATSKTSSFEPVVAEAVIDSDNRATATFPIVELGAIKASFTSTDNAAVVGLLYDGNGQLIKKYSYSEAELTISSLADGDYTLVTMTNSSLFNSILNLSQFSASGLTEGSDYVKRAVTVKSGLISTISCDVVPVLDESKLYYTGNETSFTVNKTSITAGNYLTLRGKIDFKSSYVSSVSGVKMVVDLPESCSFVENSVMVGSNVSSYTLNDNRVTIPLDNYTDQVRFCVIPTEGGTYSPSAFASFTLSGNEVMQPIGNANYEVKNLSISVPSTVAKTSVAVTGSAPGKSIVKIYDDATLIGETTALANGAWSATCELNDAYNLSTHSISAIATTSQGLELQSEVAECYYNMDAIEVSKVTMINVSHRIGSYYEENTVFDFQKPAASIPAYWYWPSYPTFTFLIDFTNNDTTKISDVVLYVKTCKGNQVPLNAKYDDQKQLWVASGDFGNWDSYDIPVNVSLDYTLTNSETKISNEMLVDAYRILSDVQQQNNEIDESITEIQNKIKEEEAKDKPDTSAIELLQDKLFNLLGVSKPSYDDNDIHDEDYDKELEEHLNSLKSLYGEWCINDFPKVVLTNINQDVINDINGNITVSTCDGYDRASLDTCFIHIPTTADTLYVNASETGVVILDFKNNVCYSIATETANSANTRAASNSSLLERIQNAISAITASYDKIVENTNKVLSVIEEVNKHIEGGIKFAQDGYCKAWMQLDKLKKAKLRGENINSLRIFALELTCDGYETEIKGLNNAHSAVGNVRIGISTKIFGALGIVNTFIECKKDLESFITLYFSIPDPCKDDKKKADGLRAQVLTAGVAAGVYYVGNATADVLSLLGIGPAVTAAPATAGSSLGVAFAAIAKLALSWGIQEVYARTTAAIKERTEKAIKTLKCYKPKDDDKNNGDNNKNNGGKNNKNKENGGGEYNSNNPDTEGVHDPSGYVYEAVESNRLEGVKATCYYKENVEDMYGDIHENVVLWDAAEYAQENPLFTDENGMYRWDVPQGLWQVKFEKDGYETTYSDWLPVPPPQLEVNIAMTQLVQPRVLTASAYENAIEIEFDKYMDASTITTEYVKALQDNNAAAGHIVMEDATTVGEQTFVKNVRLELDNDKASFALDKPVTISVSRKVESYAGKQMLEDFVQEFDVKKELTRIICDSAMAVLYGDTVTIPITILPTEVAAGKTLMVSTSSAMILSTEESEATIDDEGKAYITVVGELPGTSVLTFSVTDSKINATTIVNVGQANTLTVATPTASIASGTVVAKGSEISLTTTTEGATIYYTTDGSCPCDIETAKVYDEPIIVNGNVTIKAMAAKEGMLDSDVAEFTYTVDPSGIAKISVDGNLKIYPLPVRDKLNVSAGGKIIKSVSIITPNGTTLINEKTSAQEAHLNTNNIPAGTYIVKVSTETDTYSQKILKIE